jgi:hypothetical protein
MFRREVQEVEEFKRADAGGCLPATTIQSLLRRVAEASQSKTRQTHRLRRESVIWQPAMRLPHPKICQYAMSTVW